MDGHRCKGRSFEVRVHNWGALRGPGNERRKFVNLATKEITALFVQTSNQNTASSVAVNEPTMVLIAGTWLPVEAARAFPSLLISRRQLEVPFPSSRPLEIPAGIRRALGKPARRPSHLCSASSDGCCASPGFLCDPPHDSSLPKPPRRGPGRCRTQALGLSAEKTLLGRRPHPGEPVGAGGGGGEGHLGQWAHSNIVSPHPSASAP